MMNLIRKANKTKTNPEGRQLKKERRGFQPVLALIALAVAFGFWVYVRSVVVPYTTTTVRYIPVIFTGEEQMREDRNLMVDVVTNPMADLTLYGKRSELAELDKDSITLTVDLSGIRQAATYELPYAISYAEGLSTASVTVTDKEPAYISFSVANLTAVPIPVKGTLDGETPVAEGYLAEAMVFSPGEITIKGPEEVVSQVSYALVAMERENLTNTVTAMLPFVLMGEEGQIIESDEVTCSVSEVEVTQPIVMTKEIPLSVKFITGGGASDDNVVYDYSPKTVTISGDADALAGINQIALDPIDLSEIIGSYTAELPILIPNDTTNLSGVDTASVTVELKGLTTKVFRVTNIELALPETGYPEDLRATCITSSLQVYVRASDSIIEQIYASNIRAVADLTNYAAPGQYTVPVDVFIDGYTDAGVLNEYQIAIRVDEIDSAAQSGEGEDGLAAVSGEIIEAPVTEQMVEAVSGAQSAGVESASKVNP